MLFKVLCIVSPFISRLAMHHSLAKAMKMVIHKVANQIGLKGTALSCNMDLAS